MSGDVRSSPQGASSTVDDFDYVRVFENVGTRIYKYFSPEDIFRFSLCGRHIHEHVVRHLIQVFQQNFHLGVPLDLGQCRTLIEHSTSDPLRPWLRPFGGRTSAVFSRSQSFTSKERLITYLVQHILGGSDVRVVGTESHEESSTRAREKLSAAGEVKVEVSSLNGSVRLQPSHTASHLQPTARGRVEVGSLVCQYEADLDRNSAKEIVNAQFRAPAGYKLFAKSWLHYLLSQSDTVASYWRWVFLHPNKIESVMAAGFVITNQLVGDNMTVTFKTKV
ncbi:hypothetical protein ACHAXT_011031 [Thalassiosira profunda]